MTKDIDVQCMCGWSGRQSDLVALETEDTSERVRPECGTWFTCWPHKTIDTKAFF